MTTDDSDTDRKWWERKNFVNPLVVEVVVFDVLVLITDSLGRSLHFKS